MNIDVFRIISICCIALAALCFVVAIVLFFKLQIPDVVNDLRGKVKNESIKNREKENIKNAKALNANVNNAAQRQMAQEAAAMPKEDEFSDEGTKPLVANSVSYDNFKVIKSVVYVNTREVIKL